MYSTGINNNAALVLVLLAAAMAALTVLAGSGQAANIPPPHCNPEVADALPPRLRRICAALYGMAEISNAVEQYLDDKTMRDGFPVDGDRGVKRQDVDHVFLRFGRR